MIRIVSALSITIVTLSGTFLPHCGPLPQNYPYFKPGEKAWRDCVGSCLINNSFFQTVPEAPNLWRLVDAKKQSPPKVKLWNLDQS